ncbi:lipid-A-disaccharide synthase [Thiomicrorhabdus sp.]|uniref:lipid-A-disaccharide synthase n=1 Tax=Thiomicrorhabdus sp. TaxID=2039724 RepID=UPI0029C8712B|nr:lipid-A-disaccharide synthase [Thiomicrorhabdus sp.]
MALSDNTDHSISLSKLPSPVIALVAGEASGDTLGADLIRGLKKRFPKARFIGIGGPKMQEQGLDSWFPMERLSVMGFFEVLKRLPELLRLRRQLVQRLIETRPDVFIGVDAPDFNFTVEKRLKEVGIPTVHYVGPSVWAWREKRLLKIKQAVDGVLVLFPFETPYYDRYGIASRFVGHPLANQVPEFPDKERAKQQLKMGLSAEVTAILPGSRMSEIEQMAEPYFLAAELLQKDFPQMQFVVPCVHAGAKKRLQEILGQCAPNLSVLFLDGQSQLALEACDQALVTSGTATLECALMRRPLLLAIKLHPITHWIMKRLSTTNWIGLPNVLAQETLVSELIQDQASAGNIYRELKRLIEDDVLREKQLVAFEKQYRALNCDASSLATQAVLDWAELNEKK